MYQSKPDRISLTIAWTLTGLGGGAAILWTPSTIENEIGTLLALLWGAVTFVGGLAAAAGVALDRYRIEWIAAWVAAAGVGPYAGSLWFLIFAGAHTRAAQALLITALLVHSVTRALRCAAHADRLRGISAAIPDGGENATR